MPIRRERQRTRNVVESLKTSKLHVVARRTNREYFQVIPGREARNRATLRSRLGSIQVFVHDDDPFRSLVASNTFLYGSLPSSVSALSLLRFVERKVKRDTSALSPREPTSDNPAALIFAAS